MTAIIPTKLSLDPSPKLSGNLDTNNHNIDSITPAELDKLQGVTDNIQSLFELLRRTTPSAFSTVYGVTNTFVSPDVSSHNGYTTDGTYHYTIDTARIDKRNDDETWSVAVQNTDPLNGLSPINHCGDGHYYNGKLYIPGSLWDGEAESNPAILVYNATTLARLEANLITEGVGGGAGLCVAPLHGDRGIIYIVDYTVGTHIYKYDLVDYSYLGAITLSNTILMLQGIQLWGGRFIMTQDGGPLWIADQDGNVDNFYTMRNLPLGAGSYEGIHCEDTQWRQLVDLPEDGGKVYYLTPSTTTGIKYAGLNNQIELAAPGVTAKMRVGHDTSSSWITTNARRVTGTTFVRDNTNKPAFIIRMYHSSTLVDIAYAAAGTGNITWTQVFYASQAQGLVYCKKLLLGSDGILAADWSAGISTTFVERGNSTVTIKNGLVTAVSAAATSYMMGVVVHGATAGTARPTGYAQITWIGSVEPTNAATNDIWVNTG